MSTLRVRKSKILNFMSARSLLSLLFAHAARALLWKSSLKFGGVVMNDSEDRRIFFDLSLYVLCYSTDFTSEQVERVHN
jgi:hypothetical protein